MQALSTFQLLPPHAVEIVVDHIAGSRRGIYAGVDDPEEQAERHMPLLWVCRNFREVVYSRFCRNYELSLDGNKEEVGLTRSSWPESLKPAVDDYQTRRLVKDLYIELDIWSIYSGKSLDMLSRSPYDDLVFPLARSLTFYFAQLFRSKLKMTALKDTEVNIGAFVRRISHMAPMARIIKVETGVYSHDVHPSVSHHFTSLVSQLYRRPDHAICGSLTCAVPFWHQQELAGIVVHPDYQDYNSSESIMQLVRQNASSLQTLDLTLEQEDIAQLVQGTNGCYVSYPCLLKLDLTMLSDGDEEQWPIFAGAAPFPALQHLRISDHYPFGDDTPFRSNTSTLECLDICISAESVVAFNKHKVFTPSSHPKLLVVKIELAYGAVPNHFGSGDECMRFVLGIAPHAVIRKISSNDSDQGLSINISLLHECTRIQVLELPNTNISFWDTINLVKSLPALSDLHTMPPSMGAVPVSTTLAKLPKYVLANYASVNKRFWCWRFNMGRGGGQVAVAARCALLMALICPRLDFAPVPPARRESFMAQMRRLIATQAFKQHASRLQRLLIEK
ncbi:hypothetical protein GGI20_002709 [Coemansia sp. BCRC 34301]|nr:hypothetical protein GGI20_002709 [Coemansia sp. BCRC 34301]